MTLSQSCQDTEKTGNLDVHFFKTRKKHGIYQKILYMFLHGELSFDTGMKIKGCIRIVVKYSYNLLALNQFLSWGIPKYWNEVCILLK